MDETFDRAVDAIGTVARTALIPWGGAEACLDAWEATIRAVTDAQCSAARMIGVDPFRSFIASWADLTRDVGAAQLSTVRWILDV
jgi:hypothetical protein